MQEPATQFGDLVGREKILCALLDHIRQGRSALLLGPAGIGKTALLQAVADRARQARDVCTPMYCGEASTLKAVLKGLAAELPTWERDFPYRSGQQLSSDPEWEIVAGRRLGTLSRRKLWRLVVPRLRAGRYVLLLDHVGVVRGAYAEFLDSLVEDFRVPIVAAARSLEPGETGRLWWIGWNFENIDVPPLGPADAHRLVECCLDRAHVILPDRQAFTKGVTKLALGNARAITRLCEMAGSPRYHIDGRTDLRLLWLDLKMRNVQQRIDAEARIPLVGPIPFISG